MSVGFSVECSLRMQSSQGGSGRYCLTFNCEPEEGLAVAMGLEPWRP